MDDGIEDETVDATIPRDVDEPDEATVLVGTDVYQALSQHGIPVPRCVPAPGGCE
jgi:hypothetical protein